MRRIISFIVLGAFFASVLSSCLKDKPFMDVSNTQPIIEFGQSAANGIYGPGNEAYQYATDTAGSPMIDTAIALVIASPQVLNDSIAVTIVVDTTVIAPFNGSSGSSYSALPDSLYSLPTTTIVIPPGYRVGRIPVTLNFPSFSVPHNYALPISIVNAVDKENPNNLIVVSGNSGKFMWLFQQ